METDTEKPVSFNPEDFKVRENRPRLGPKPEPPRLPRKVKYSPFQKGCYEVAGVEECLAIGSIMEQRRSGLGASLIITTLLREAWRYQVGQLDASPFNFPFRRVERYGVTRETFITVLDELERCGWIRTTIGQGQSRKIEILREF